MFILVDLLGVVFFFVLFLCRLIVNIVLNVLSKCYCIFLKVGLFKKL